MIENISPLTLEEAQTLQADVALRKIGELDAALVETNQLYAEKLKIFSDARIELEIVKAQKGTIVERMRNLKAFIKGTQVNL